VNKNFHIKETLEKIISKDCSIQVFGLGYVGFLLSIKPGKSRLGLTTFSNHLLEKF